MNRLIDILLQMFRFFPRLQIITPEERGVVIRLGKMVGTISNGWYIYWPIITEIRTLNITRQLIDVDMQDLTTKDGKHVTINMSVEYEVKNAKKALLDVMDYDENIQEIAGNSMREVIGRCDKVNINIDEIVEEVYGYIDKDCKKYGIKVVRVLVPTYSLARTIRVIQ